MTSWNSASFVRFATLLSNQFILGLYYFGENWKYHWFEQWKYYQVEAMFKSVLSATVNILMLGWVLFSLHSLTLGQPSHTFYTGGTLEIILNSQRISGKKLYLKCIACQCDNLVADIIIQ